MGSHKMSEDATYWLCWTNNCRSRNDVGLYVMHVIEETGKKTLCGCEIQEIGNKFDPATHNWPSCKRCEKAVIKLGFVEAEPQF